MEHLLAKIAAIKENVVSHHEMMMMADVRAWRKETDQEEMEANPEEIESELEHPEVPTEEAAVETFRTQKKRHRSRHVASGPHEKLKE
jgi:hypothetical protein